MESRMRSWRYIIFMVILHSKHIISDGDLPKGAKIVERCPEPKNWKAWKMASKRLGCNHSGNISSEQSQVYHCLPSSLLNEFVELCGITAPIGGGNCPVLQYVNTTGRNRSPTSWNCSTFSTGCPSEFYLSRDIYKYPECLNLDRSHHCFRADNSCMINNDSTRSYSLEIGNQTETELKFSTIGYDIMNNNAGQNWNIFYVVLGLLIFSGIVISVLVAIIFKLNCPIREKKIRTRNICQGEDYQAASFLNDPKEEHQPEEDELTSVKINWSPVTQLLCQLAEEIPDEKIPKLKFLLKSNNRKNCKGKDDEISGLERYDLFLYMDREYNFNVNMHILMGYMEAIEEEKLLEKCEEYVKNAKPPPIYYMRDRGDTESTEVRLKVAMDIGEFNCQIEIDIVNSLQKLLGCKKDNIRVRRISEGCVLLHLDVKSTLLEKLRKCDFTCMRKHKVFKISIMEECIFYWPDLDDNFHKKEDFTKNFVSRMFNRLKLYISTCLKLCKICQTVKQSRINGKMCNREASTTKTIESMNIEHLESSKECLEKVLEEKSSKEFTNLIMEPESTKKQWERDMENITKKEIQEKIYGKDKTEIQAETDVKDETDMQEGIDDLHCSSDFRNVCSYDCLLEDTVQVFRFMNRLVDLPAFECHIRQDSHKMHDIKGKLEMRMHDLMKTDCAIVVAGETNSEKSSIINLIIGEVIVPTGIMETTTRVCRIKYSDKMQVSTLDKEGKELFRAEFNDKEELTEMIEELATTDDEEIEYIDVWIPVPILKGNIIIVDTPGKGDTEHDDVAKKMVEYLPNALAFIFVVNVASAGGFQDDRLLHNIKRVRESMNQMYCFDPEDAIFVFNKWDAVVEKKRKGEKDTYEEFKDKAHAIWEDVKCSKTLKFASAKVQEEMAYENEFAKFKEILKDVITKNEFKRVKVHLGFIKSFLDDCDVSLSNKLRCARQSTDEAIKELDQLDTDLQVIRNKREEVYSSLQESVDQFLEETTEDLYQYIHSAGFKSTVLQGTERYTWLTIGRELETRIEKATLSWQQDNIGVLFERKILQNLTDNFVKIHESLHKIKNKMRGFTSPFDVEDKLGPVLLSLIAPSGTAVAGSIAMMYMSVSPKAASAVATAGVVSGLVCTGLVALDVLDDFDTVTKNAYKARIDKITKEKIRKMLHKTYEEKFKAVVKSYLEGDLKIEIDDLSKSVESTKNKVDSYKTEESSLLSLSSEISKIRKLVEKFENIEIKLD